MAPMPEPIPVATAIRPSAGSRSSSRASSEPKPALIWPVGPSRPPEPPEPMVRADATILTITARKRTPRGLWCTAEMAASVPCPSASGAMRKTRIAPSSAPNPGDERERPRTGRRSRRGQAAFTGRRRHLVAGAHVQEEVGAHDERLVEHDGAQPGDGADHDTEDAPLL